MNATYDCIVIGGGISGISFAHYLKKAGKHVLLLEKDDRMGGQIHTGRLPDTDFWYETGAHTCYNTYVSLLAVLRDVQEESSILQRNKYSYKILTEKGLQKIAAGLSVAEMLLHLPKMFLSGKKGKTVEEYYRPFLGSRNYDRLFSKAFRAILSQPADNYPAELLMKRRKQRCKELPGSFSFSGGFSAMIDAIVAKDGFSMETGETVTNIRKTGFGYEVNTLSGKQRQASSIALAIDPQAASGLLAPVEPQVAALLADIPVFRSESLSVIVRQEIPVVKMAGIIPLNDDFLSAVSRDVVGHPLYRCFTFHFIHEDKSPDEQRAIVCRTLGIRQEDIVSTGTTYHRLPSLRLPHVNIKDKIETVKINPDIHLLGNYFGGLSIEDCVIRSLEEAGKM